MSADNGIYVIETFGPEYRMGYAHAIDNIFGKFNNQTLHWDGDINMIREYFRDSAVYGSLDEALDKAEELHYNYEYLEDGICVIDEFKELNFKED